MIRYMILYHMIYDQIYDKTGVANDISYFMCGTTNQENVKISQRIQSTVNSHNIMEHSSHYSKNLGPTLL